ncbi:MAG: succinate dehydrogenase, cytochrome b556 subunit [Methylacidiphilales bacterium]|nr:succinate dehydrogenase, cytochrome b556 subunit [Candidatus Methylacidiphilales bacterium]
MKKPLISPHLEIYSFPLVSVLSIMHRVSGSVLVICSLSFPILFWYLMYDPNILRSALSHYFAKITSSLIIFSFTYHFLSGIRHLLLDSGFGFSLKTAYFAGLFLLSATIVASSLIIWVLIL